jgi:hypothetical protein
VKYFYTEFLTSQVYPSTARVLRFTLDLNEGKVMYSYLIPQVRHFFVIIRLLPLPFMLLIGYNSSGLPPDKP